MKRAKNWRLSIVLALILLFGAAIIGRLFFLQILERKLFQAQALGQQMGFSSVIGARGQIFSAASQEKKGQQSLSDLKSLAINKDSWTVTANTALITDKLVFADSMSRILGTDRDELFLKISGSEIYVVVARGLSSEKLGQIKALNPEGVTWQNNPGRFYPQGDFLSKTLGFLGGEGSGQYGLEGYYNDILSGKTGIKQEKTGIDSIFFNDSQVSLDGSDLYLTIDYNIQFQAESLLKKAKEDLDIDEGQIIVMKPDSGRILALADYPSFDPNQYSREKNLEVFQNGAVQKLFEPGSILKPFTMASALNEKKITPDTTYIDEGFVNFGAKTIHNFNYRVYGQQTMTQVLEKSINTGAVFAEQQIGKEKFFEYIKRFGFVEKTGIDLQGEIYSRNESLKEGRGPDINFATASFGQGIELTPMQVIRGFSAIVNGGRLVRPYIVEKIVSGTDEIKTKPEISEPIISQETVSQLTSMLINAVENGFDKAAKIPGYYLAGKTGTAQVPLKGAYDPDKTIQSFVGFAPAFNPQFLILVKLDNPKVSKSSLSAAPIFKELAQYIINYWKIPPDYDINN